MKRTGVTGAPSANRLPAKAAQKPAQKAIQKSAPAASGKALARPAAAPVVRASGAQTGSTRPAAQRPAAKRSFKSVAAPARPAKAASARKRGALGAIGGFFAGIAGAIAGLFRRIPLPRVGKGVVLAVAGAAVALVLAFLIVANTGIFAASDVRVEGGEHVSAEEAEALLDLPENATLLNVDTVAIDESLQKNPWLLGADIERQFPHTLVIKPRERTLAAVAYIAADNVAWGIGSDGNWIAPITLAVTVDADGEIIEDTSRLATGAAVTELSGAEAALALAKRDGAVLLTDVSTDVSPSSGAAVDSEVILAGLAYANGFSEGFIAQVKDISVPSVEAIAVNLESGVEVSVGAPENIETKERVVTKLLAQEKGVTYINVRTPEAYTFRGVDTE